MIKIIDTVDSDLIYSSYKKIESNIVWAEQNYKGKQTSLQYKLNDDVWISAIGKSKGDELSYNLINPYFKNTVFEELINKYNLKRTRFLWLHDHACYSMHKDTTPRIHIPIVTNPQCFFVFRSGYMENLYKGNVYLVDTTVEHTALNGGDSSRLHLVGVVEK